MTIQLQFDLLRCRTVAGVTYAPDKPMTTFRRSHFATKLSVLLRCVLLFRLVT